MIQYKISTGELSHDGKVLGVGYSGQPGCKNDPDRCDMKDMGPIPTGKYTIGEPRDTDTHGPFVLPLTPHPDNVMYGRSAFLIHGDSKSRPGTASHGCIIQDRTTREATWATGDRELEVVA